MSDFFLSHVHTSYDSVRDSCLKIEDYVKTIKEYGASSCAVSGHGSLSSAYKFYKKCKEYEIKPVIGIEFYMAENARDKGENYHLCAYAKNNNGWKTLCKLSSLSYTPDYFYRKPRIDLSLLNQYHDDIIISTACAFSYPANKIINNEIDQCNSFIDSLYKIFDEDLYLEIMDHGFEDEIKVKNHYRNYGREKGIKIIGTSDTHYLLSTDKEFHGIFKNISYASGEGKDSSFDGNDYHVYTYKDMISKFLQEEIDNGLELSSKCNIDFNFKGYHLPSFEVPNKEQDSYEYLKELCYKALKQKGLDKDQKYIGRLEYELYQLHICNLENYFLIIMDSLNWCRENKIMTGFGRGSAAGMLICYLLKITGIDPIKHDLLFERAVNKGRMIQQKFFED